LSSIKKEVRDELKKFDKDHELSKIEERIQIFDDSIDKAKSSLNENKSALELYEDQLDTVEKNLGNSSSAVVDQLIKQRDAAQKSRTLRSSQLASLEAQKVSLIREYSWVAFANNLSDEALDFIDEAELKGTIPAPFNLQLVKDILEREECVCGACIKPGTKAFEKINELTKEAADPDLLQRLQKARSRLTAIKTLSPQAYERIEKNFKDVRSAQDEIQALDSELDEISTQILQLDDDEIRKLEKERSSLKLKVRETQRAVDRLDEKLKTLIKDRSALQDEASRIEGLSPRAKVLKHKLNVIEGVEEQIAAELDESERSIHDILKDKIDSFLEKYLRQDYKVLITSDLNLCLQDRNGKAVPPSGGQGAILSFIYISSLISIARERRELESTILTPGAIAPLIFDAPFSKLDPKYSPNIARELPKLVDQLIILMYQDEGKNVTSTFLEEGSLGKEYYFCEQIAGQQGDRKIHELNFGEQSVVVTEYGAAMDKVVVKEVERNV
jgi:DNA sulfur modification protein DndD